MPLLVFVFPVIIEITNNVTWKKSTGGIFFNLIKKDESKDILNRNSILNNKIFLSINKKKFDNWGIRTLALSE